jgi:hypothetical protein
MTRKLVPLLLLLAGAPAFAQTNAPVSSQERQQIVNHEVDQLVNKLGLDASGAARFRQTFASYQAKLAPLRKEQFQAHRALKQELANPQPDAARLSQLTDDLQNNRLKMQSIEQERSAELRQQLTPAQYAQLIVSRREIMRDMHKQFRAARRQGASSVQ